MQFSFHTIDLPEYTAKCIEIARLGEWPSQTRRLRIGILTDYPASCVYAPINLFSDVYSGQVAFYRLCIAWQRIKTPRIITWITNRLAPVLLSHH